MQFELQIPVIQWNIYLNNPNEIYLIELEIYLIRTGEVFRVMYMYIYIYICMYNLIWLQIYSIRPDIHVSIIELVI